MVYLQAIFCDVTSDPRFVGLGQICEVSFFDLPDCFLELRRYCQLWSRLVTSDGKSEISFFDLF